MQMKITKAMAALLLLAVSVCALAETAVGPQYSVKTKVWMNGDLRGTPELVVQAESDAMIENRSGDDAWRMHVLVEAPHESENAMDGAIWIKLGIEQEVDGEWEFLTDTLLGLPPGQTGSISVVGEHVEIATPENANLFVEVTVQPVTDSQ